MSSDSKAPVRTVKKVQFGILSPDEIVSTNKANNKKTHISIMVILILAPNVSH